MNIITIDPSLISTSMVINGDIYNYCREDLIIGKKSMNKWYKYAEPYINYTIIDIINDVEYSDKEILKIISYTKTVNKIINDINCKIDVSKKTLVVLEGYSFSSKVGDFIDLITFSTLLRSEIYNRVTKNMYIISPKSLKLESCKLTYKPKEIGVKKKKLYWTNNDGVSGGMFKKKDMLKCIIENELFVDKFSNHCKEIGVELMELSSIPKPYEDSIDSFLLYNVVKNNLQKYASGL